MFEYLLYYPVTAILWFWHKVFGTVFGEAQAISWVLAIVFLTFTIRAILFKPFVSQVRSMKKMQDFAPEIKKIQKRYANDKQRQAQAMQKLQREHGVNPLGSCLPILLQVPVFIGLNHVLRSFGIHYEEHPNWGLYTFGRGEVEQYIDADLFGSNLGDAVYNAGALGMSDDGFHAAALPVAIPLMIVASVLTHLTARHSVARQNPANASQQSAVMNKLTLWVFPVGLLVFGVMIPIGLLLYFLANNAWTLMQQRVVYTRIDREEEVKKTEALEKRGTLAPKPGQKPAQGKKRPAGQKPGQAPKPGQKPAKQGGDKQAAKDSEAKDSEATDSGAKSDDAAGNGSSQPKGDAATKASGNGKAPGKSTGKPSGKSAGGASGGGSGQKTGQAKKKSGRKRR